jgi:hypothetical protein
LEKKSKVDIPAPKSLDKKPVVEEKQKTKEMKDKKEALEKKK